MRIASLLCALFCGACAPDPVLTPAPKPARFEDSPRDVTEYAARPGDFDCILDTPDQPGADPQTAWHHVRNFYLKNMTGRAQEALDVANGLKPGPYPVGTIIQLIYFEAMVKRAGGFSPDSGGWEFFSLDADGQSVVVNARGGTEVVNFAGANCFDCHSKAEPQFDFVCEGGHGCDALGVDADFIHRLQAGDPRCRVSE